MGLGKSRGFIATGHWSSSASGGSTKSSLKVSTMELRSRSVMKALVSECLGASDGSFFLELRLFWLARMEASEGPLPGKGEASVIARRKERMRKKEGLKCILSSD